MEQIETTDITDITDARSPAQTPGVPRPRNIKALTSIRFFAALHVALYHFVRPFSLWGPFASAISVGYVGVSFFFLLSGFILTYSHAAEYELGKGRAENFWIARFARIYPVYLLSMLFSAYVNKTQFHPRFHIIAYVAGLFMVQTWSVRLVNFFNVPAWSISTEAFFYLVFPFLFLRLRPSSAIRSMLTMAALWLLALAAPLICLYLYPLASWSEGTEIVKIGGVQAFWVRRFPVLALPQFLAGVSLGWFYLRFGLRPRSSAILATAGVLTLTVALSFANHLPFVVLHNGLLLPAYAMLILGVCEANWLSRILSFPALVLLGEASFALYLFHFLFNDWSKKHLGMDATIPSALIKLAIVIPVSILLHLFIERPGRRLILQHWRSTHPPVSS